MGTVAKFCTICTFCTILAACTTTPSGSFCDIAKPLRPSASTIDAMTDAEVAAMLAHNRKGAALCKWKP
jgi:hypothetical protein